MRAAASDLATSTTRPPPSATDRSPVDGREQLAGHVLDQPVRHVVHGRRRLDHVRRQLRRALGRQQRVAGPAEHVDRLGHHPAAEADRALAVVPGEAGRAHPLAGTPAPSSYQEYA